MVVALKVFISMYLCSNDSNKEDSADHVTLDDDIDLEVAHDELYEFDYLRMMP